MQPILKLQYIAGLVFIDPRQMHGTKPAAEVFCRSCGKLQAHWRPSQITKQYRLEKFYREVRACCSLCGLMFFEVPLSDYRRYQTFKADGHKCVYCGRGGDLTVDHQVPVTKGGDNSPENCVTCCSDCNRRKSAGSFDAPRFGRFTQRELMPV